MQPSPICFSAVRGQEKAKHLIARALHSKRISHAYLFKGPDGVGKKLFGRGVAAALNCRDKRSVHACGSCPSCRKYNSGNHPDFVVIEPDNGIVKINQVREMTRGLEYPPYESRYRVVLLEDVHTMRPEAANALLKTLEEPPENNVLILSADSGHELLSTISSRCQVIPFSELGFVETVEVISQAEPGLTEKKRKLLARLSEGSPGKALLLNQTGLAELLEKIVGLVSDSSTAGDKDILLLLDGAREMAELKEHLAPFLSLVRFWLRDLLVASHEGVQEGSLYGLGGRDGTTPKVWSSEELFSKLDAVGRAEDKLRRNCNRALVSEVLLFTLRK